MHEVDEYLATVTFPQRTEFERIGSIVKQVIPSVGQGTSYGMAAFMYQGWPVLSFAVTKKFLSIYPFSGKVIEKLKNELTNFETTPGSIHFSIENPIPELLLKKIIIARQQEIAGKVPR